MGEPRDRARPGRGRGRAAGHAMARGAALAAAVLVLAWTVARDPVAAIYAREAARLELGSRPSTAETSIVLRLLNRSRAPQARVLVNGRPMAEFDSGEVHLDVRHGDRIQVDARSADGAIVILVDDGAGGPGGRRVVTVVGSLETVPWAGWP